MVPRHEGSRKAELRALDLYSGAGGASRGLMDAGFSVTGVDIAPQPNYCGHRFIQADVLALSVDFIASFDFAWASPPCQALSAMRRLHNARPHLNLIPQTRALLKASGRPYTIENVEEARWALIDPVRLCGSSFGLEAAGRELRRHKLFEISGFRVVAPQCAHTDRPVLGIYGGHVRDRRRPAGANHQYGSNLPISVGREAMGVEWMTGAKFKSVDPSRIRGIYRPRLAAQLAADLGAVRQCGSDDERLVVKSNA